MNQDDESDFINVVLGNQSADLDSIASSLAFAELLNLQRPKLNHDEKFVAVINIPRSEVKLRSDILYVLRIAFSRDISPELLFIDEINLHKLATENRLRLILVDHHELAPDQADLWPSIRKIVDHHRENVQILDQLRERNVELSIETVGSCCTLVAERYFNTQNVEISPEFALLLYAAIVVDTSYFTVALNKATPKDIKLGKILQEIIVQHWKGFDFRKFYNEVLEMRENVDGLSMKQILAKDYKYFTIENSMSVGFSTIRCNLENLISKSEGKDHKADLQSFSKLKNIRILIILSNLSKAERYLAIFAPEINDLRLIKSIFEQDQIFKDLNLTFYNLNGNEEDYENFIVYNRGNIFWTRKQILPFLKTALESEYARKSTSSGKKFLDGKGLDRTFSVTYQGFSDQNAPSSGNDGKICKLS